MTTPRLSGTAFSRGLGAALIALACATAFTGPAAHAATARDATSAAASHPSRAFWLDIKGRPAAAGARGTAPSLSLKAFRSATLDRTSLVGFARGAPHESNRAAPLTVSLPAPDGTFQRFTLVETAIMESGLAARHPEIKTYAGLGLDDPSAHMVMDISPLGVHVAVRSKATGPWFIDPYYHLDESLYASYFARDLNNVHGERFERMTGEASISLSRAMFHGRDKVSLAGSGFAPNAQVVFTVKAQGDVNARQTVYAMADAEGLVSTSFTAEPYRARGAFEVSATDGRQTADASYSVVADAAAVNALTGPTLKTYRLALVSDPTYAAYFGGPANVTAAKVTLINRVSQFYETETAIRLQLINATDALNLDTAAQATGANGPCGGSACFTAAQIASCGGGTLSRNRIVAGLLAGASNFDIGHIAVGVNGGGIASLGVVGGNNKAQGCTGIPTPVGDFYAIDYVAHEMGHEFSGNHTFNGTISNCSAGNRNAGTSVEPGSGSSVMAYAGICGTDNLQSHSDPYWSQRSFDEVTTYTSSAETSLNEVQYLALTGYTGTASFVLSYNGQKSAPIVRGSNFTVAGIKAAIEAIPGWPSGGTITASTVGDTAVTLTYGGTLAGTNVPSLAVESCDACSGFVGEIAKGGLTTKNGISQTPSGNAAPVVSTAAGYTIPVRTPFVLTGSAIDDDGDPVTFMWEQNDRGAAAGTGLITQPKLNGPLFRQFGTRALVSGSDTLQFGSPNENLVTQNPTRVFPDMAQVLANNTNAETGSCPTASSPPTGDQIDCFSEYLPTAAYVGFVGTNASPASLNFRLTGRDGKGGVGSASTQLVLAATAGPFLVTSPNTAVSLPGASTQTVTWSVANTDVAPVGTTQVKISLSTDGGLNFPYVLAAAVPNTGSAPVVLPSVLTSTARIKVEAVGNVFFDVSNADFAITAPVVAMPGDLDGNGAVDCADLAIVRAAMGSRTGDANFNAAADVNKDGVVDARDLAYVSQRVTSRAACSR